MSIAYNYSGKHQDLATLLRRFQLGDLLHSISKYSADLMKNHNSESPKEASWEKYHVLNGSTRGIEEKNTLVTGWNLIDLAYYAIRSTNDYRGKVIENKEEFLFLVDAIWATKEVDEIPVIESFNDDSPDILFYLFGFMTEQFRFQDLKLNNVAVSRELYMLLDIAPTIDGLTDIPVIIQEEVGTDWKAIVISLYLLFAATLAEQTIDTVIKHSIWNETVTKSDFEKVLRYFSASYNDVRTSSLGRQFLYTKPFIKTDKTKETICISPQLCLMLYEHALYWIVRNYYLKREYQRFTSEFGIVFEKYFYQLLRCTMKEEYFERIPEDDQYKRADWRINLPDYQILLEQKSAALGLMAKQQETDIETLKKYCVRNLIDAISQLDATEKYYDDGKYIKIILIYEEYLNTHILEQVFRLPKCSVQDDGYFWLMTIGEVEMLFSLYKNDPVLFKAVIEKKSQLEKSKAKDGRAIEQILRAYGITDNVYLQQEEFSKYKGIGLDSIRALLPKQ